MRVWSVCFSTSEDRHRKRTFDDPTDMVAEVIEEVVDVIVIRLCGLLTWLSPIP